MKIILLLSMLWLSKAAFAQQPAFRKVETSNGVIELRHGARFMSAEQDKLLLPEEAKILSDTLEAHPQDLELDRFWGSGSEQGYSHEPRVKIRLEVYELTRLADFYQLKVYIYQGSEAEPNPSVLPEQTRSGDWKQYGDVSTSFNPYWIQLPRNHFFRLVAHHKSGNTIEVLQQIIHSQQGQTIRFDF